VEIFAVSGMHRDGVEEMKRRLGEIVGTTVA
jgi:hypothetical protein